VEAAGALLKGNFSTYREAAREVVRARSRVFWIVAGLTALAATARFATLGVQSYHHDEIVTAHRILRGSFWHAMDSVGFSESAPPLYYALAWPWAQVAGTGEFGLRSLSALAGVATIPVAYLLARDLSSKRAGLMAAALVAVNPMLIWYSQEARAYSLLALLCSLSLLYFVRALRDVPSVIHPYGGGGETHGTSRAALLWGVFSGLALATHYFAIFPIAAEALWLLWRRRREALPGVAIVAGFGVALAPLVVHQMSIGHAEWIGDFGLWHRLWETGLSFMLGETGEIISRPEQPLLAVLPALLAIAALVLIFFRGERDGRRAAQIPLAIAAVTVAVPLLVALLAPGKDFVIARNLIPALVPLLVAVAIGCTLRRSRRAGAAIGAALAVYSLGFSVWAGVSPALQRPDWRAVASTLGEPTTPRAVVTWTIGEGPLHHYLSTSSFQVRPRERFDWWVGEVDFVSDGPAPPPSRHLLGPGFRQAGYEPAGRLYVRRYVRTRPGLAPLRLRTVRDADLGFRTNGVLLNGIGPQ